MSRIIIWTSSAANDLENIIKYIPKKSEAKSRLTILLNSLLKLEQFPMNAKALSELPSGKYYELKVANLRLVFKPGEDKKIYILAIVHDLYK